MISISRLSKRYSGADRDALAELSLDISAGQVFGLLGPNGAGKSTLISILCGLAKPTGGEVRILDLDPHAHRREIGRQVAVVPQSLAFYPDLTVAQNLDFYAAATMGCTGQSLKRAIESAQLAPHLDQLASRLSGGLKRRLNLAIGLLGSARILLLDEPTVGVDAQSRMFLLETVKRLADEGRTLIYTSHYLDELEQISNRVGVLDQGRLLVDSSIDEIRAAYGSLEAAYLKLTHRALRE